MLIKLDFSVTFAQPERTISGQHNFETGLTAITGANETGKSLRLEMIRYALFGVKALRGGAKSIKKISVELDFSINGRVHKVLRQGNKATLQWGEPDQYGFLWNDIAVGTTPVNDAITRILGYDMEVFDVANACNQGEIEALTQKTPSERKRMVDRTIGLDAVDHVLADVQADLTSTRKAMEMMTEMVLQKHEEPVIPHDLKGMTLEAAEEIIRDLNAKKEQKNLMEEKLKWAFARAPEPITFDPLPGELDSFMAEAEAVEVEFAKMSGLKQQFSSWQTVNTALAGIDVKTLAEYLYGGYVQKWIDYNEYEAKRVAKPDFTFEDIEFLHEGNTLSTHEEVDVDCPACNHTFSLDLRTGGVKKAFDWEKYKALRAKLNISSHRDIVNREQELLTYDRFIKLPVVEKPEMDEMPKAPALIHVLEMYKNFSEAGFNPAEADEKLKNAEAHYQSARALVREKIATKKKQLEAQSAFDKQSAEYSKYIALKEELQPKIDALGDVEARLIVANEMYVRLRQYLQAKQDYDTKQEAQATALQTMKDLETNFENLQRVKKALVELKPRVKTYLLPSLNHVASNLLSQMTNGQRNQVVVNEEFDIMVDGQPVNTLSGSAKAVANLAVRIGLGMVLTNKVFSVLLADEIDAAMDDERAAYTAQCLRNLASTIKQIVLVSHKQPDADNTIQL